MERRRSIAVRLAWLAAAAALVVGLFVGLFVGRSLGRRDRAGQLHRLLQRIELPQNKLTQTLALIEHDVVLHPDTIAIWNALAEEKSKAKKKGYE